MKGLEYLLAVVKNLNSKLELGSPSSLLSCLAPFAFGAKAKIKVVPQTAKTKIDKLTDNL